MKYKTLVIGYGDYLEYLVYLDEVNQWCTTNAPTMYPETVTIELLKLHHPNPDFGDGRLVTIEIKIIE